MSGHGARAVVGLSLLILMVAGCGASFVPEASWTSRTVAASRERWVRSVDFSPDGEWVVSGDDAGAVVRWDRLLRDSSVLSSLDAGIDAVCFSPDGQLVAASSGGAIHLIDARTGVQRGRIEAHGSSAGIAFSPDGQLMATVGLVDHAAKVWRTGDGGLVASFETPEEHLRPRRYQYSPMSITSFANAAWSPDGRIIAAASEGTVRLWNVATRKLLLVYKKHTSPVTSVHFSAEGGTVLSTSQLGGIHIWRVEDGRTVVDVEWPGRCVDAGYMPQNLKAQFSPDGDRVIAVSHRLEAVVVSARDGRLLAALDLGTHSVVNVAYSPIGGAVMCGWGVLLLWRSGEM